MRRTKIITTLKVRMYRQTLLYIYILTFRVVIILVLHKGDPWIFTIENQNTFWLLGLWLFWFSMMEIHESPQRRTKIITTLKVRMYRQTLLYIYILTFRVVIILVLHKGDPWIFTIENQNTFWLLGLWLFWFSMMEIHESPQRRTKIITTLKVRMYRQTFSLYIHSDF